MENPALVESLTAEAPGAHRTRPDRLELVARLYKERAFGSQYLFCSLLRGLPLLDVVPQLVQIMVMDPLPGPIYFLLLEKSRRSVSFRTHLFLALRSMLIRLDGPQATQCYHLCCDLLDVDSREQKRNTRTLVHNCVAGEKRRRGLPGAKGPSRMLRRTRVACQPRKRLPTFPGLVLSFVRAVSSLFSDEIFGAVDSVSKRFNNRRTYKNLLVKKPAVTKFRSSLLFYDYLVSLSSSLRRIPQELRQRTLIAELGIMSNDLAGVLNPLDSSTCIASILTEECNMLDSAENAPYVLVVEVVDRSVALKGRDDLLLHRAELLRSHLHSVNELGDVGDINGIRENILDALEKVLQERERSMEPAAAQMMDARGQITPVRLLGGIIEEMRTKRKVKPAEARGQQAATQIPNIETGIQE